MRSVFYAGTVACALALGCHTDEAAERDGAEPSPMQQPDTRLMAPRPQPVKTATKTSPQPEAKPPTADREPPAPRPRPQHHFDHLHPDLKDPFDGGASPRARPRTGKPLKDPFRDRTLATVTTDDAPRSRRRGFMSPDLKDPFEPGAIVPAPRGPGHMKDPFR